MSTLADRLRAHGVSEHRIFSMGLAVRSGELPDAMPSDDDLALAHEYEAANAFDKPKVRAKNPEGVLRGVAALRAINGWIERKQIQKKHGFAK